MVIIIEQGFLPLTDPLPACPYTPSGYNENLNITDNQCMALAQHIPQYYVHNDHIYGVYMYTHTHTHTTVLGVIKAHLCDINTPIACKHNVHHQKNYF